MGLGQISSPSPISINSGSSLSFQRIKRQRIKCLKGELLPLKVFLEKLRLSAV